jgi:hypothetical protein
MLPEKGAFFVLKRDKLSIWAWLENKKGGSIQW